MRSPAPVLSTCSDITSQITTAYHQDNSNLQFMTFNMQFNKAVQFAVLAMVITLDATASAAIKICGRQLSEIMNIVCHRHMSLRGDIPTVVEQPGTAARRKRELGIADECCVNTCTWDQLRQYCPISTYSESPLEDLAHIIADRSAEQGASDVKYTSPAEAAAAAVPAVGSAGHVAGRRGARPGRRCWCRRKRRSGRRRSSLMGNMGLAKSVVHRAAPLVGTVSPLITWGRTLNTDPSARRNNYAYVVYT